MTADYVTGDAMNGTGPYKFVSARIGEVYELARNDDYWGETPAWENVTEIIIGSGPARLAALLAGDVDLIDAVAATDVPKLETNEDVSLWATPTNRVAFLSLDLEHEVSIEGQAADNNGDPLPSNPMLDLRVRKALSMAIDRTALVERGLSGDAFPATQLVPEGLFGYNPDLELEVYDPAAAKALLAEAGYPEGFQIVLSAANTDPQRPRAIQAIGQMWARIGVRAEIETMPQAVFIPATNDFKYGQMLHSWGTSTGESSYTLRGLAGTRNMEAGTGTSNRGRYSNEKVDALIREASGTADDTKRSALLQEAMKIVIKDDYGILPLYSPKATWASNTSVVYAPSKAIRTTAQFATPAE